MSKPNETHFDPLQIWTRKELHWAAAGILSIDEEMVLHRFFSEHQELTRNGTEVMVADMSCRVEPHCGMICCCSAIVFFRKSSCLVG